MSEYSDSSVARLTLKGSYQVDRAASLKTELEAALAASSYVLLDLSQVEDIGLASLQLIYAARRSALAEGKNLHLMGSLNPRIVSRLGTAGFIKGEPDRAEELEAALIDF